MEDRGRVCKGEVLGNVLGVLLIYAGEFWISCKEGLIGDIEKSRVLPSCREGQVLSARSGGMLRKAGFGVGDRASVVVKLEACSV